MTAFLEVYRPPVGPRWGSRVKVVDLGSFGGTPGTRAEVVEEDPRVWKPRAGTGTQRPLSLSRQAAAPRGQTDRAVKDRSKWGLGVEGGGGLECRWDPSSELNTVGGEKCRLLETGARSFAGRVPVCGPHPLRSSPGRGPGDPWDGVKALPTSPRGLPPSGGGLPCRASGCMA